MSKFEIPQQLIKGVREERDGKSFDTISFKSVDGKTKTAVHLSMEEEVDRTLKESDEVKVRGRSGIFILSFGEYLARLGLSYGHYFKAMKSRPEDDINQILKDLHKEIISQRSRVASQKHKQYTSERADRDNLQQETARDHGPFFNSTVNDLGIDGLEAEEAPARVDYLDGIDEIIILDHQALQTDGEESSSEPIKIGIQRSFRDKGAEVKGDPVRFIPEDPEAGPVFRVFVLEDLDDYVDLSDESTLYQKLLDIRTKKARELGLSPNDYAKGKRNQGLPTVDKVLPGGVKEQVKRVHRVLEAIKTQLGDYIHSQGFDTQSQAVQVALKKQYEEIKIDDFLNAVDELVLSA